MTYRGLLDRRSVGDGKNDLTDFGLEFFPPHAFRLADGLWLTIEYSKHCG
jgi:hypothetical protein